MSSEKQPTLTEKHPRFERKCADQKRAFGSLSINSYAEKLPDWGTSEITRTCVTIERLKGVKRGIKKRPIPIGIGLASNFEELSCGNLVDLVNFDQNDASGAVLTGDDHGVAAWSERQNHAGIC